MKLRLSLNGACSLTAILAFLSACGGGGPAPAPGPNPGPIPAPSTFSVGGTISGLSGTVVLQNSGGNNLSKSTNGAFTFSTAIANGASYAVTVLTQPSGQTCSVAGGGNISSANVTTVAVTCTNDTYAVGGVVSGLGAGKNVVLQNNGAGSVNVAANGAFSFTNPLTTGATYNATIVSQPSGQVCTIAGGSGTVASAAVTSVAVTCTNVSSGFTVGGTVSGLGVGKTLVLHGVSDGVSVMLGVTANGPFTLPAAFPNQAEYLLMINAQPVDQLCKVTPKEGDVNGANVTNIAVTCQSKAAGAKNWGTADTLSVRSQIEFLPKVAMSSNGDGMAVWESVRVPGTANDVYYSHYTPSTGWSAPAIIPRLSPLNPFGDNSREPDVAMDSNGNAIAVWNGPATGQGFDVWASRFTPAGGWSQREMIHSAHPDFQDGRSPIRIAFDAGGNAIAAWTGAFGIQYNRYTVGVGWATPPDHGMVSTLGSSIDSDPGLAVNASGDAVLVWQQHPGLVGERRLWSSRYSVATGTWSVPVMADSTAGVHNGAGETNVVLDAAGNATATWTHFDGSRLRVMANRQVGGVWGTATELETTFAGTPQTGLSSAYDTRSATGGNGVVFVMWRQQFDDKQGFMRATRFVPGSGWEAPVTIGDYVPLFSHITDTNYAVAANTAGNAVFVWALTPGEFAENVAMPADIWSNQYVAGGGWSIPEIIGGIALTEGTAHSANPSVAIDGGGNALAVWEGETATQDNDISFNRMQ